MAPGETRRRRSTTAGALPRLLRAGRPRRGGDRPGVEYTFRAQVADRWRVGRVFLAGDAAHLSPPFVGQGLGLGLRDVHQLAWKLAAVLAGGADDDLLDTYQAEREPHARALIRVAQLLGRLMTRRRPRRRRRAPRRAGRRPADPGGRPGWRPTAGRRRCGAGRWSQRRGRAGRRLAGHAGAAARGGRGRAARAGWTTCSGRGLPGWCAWAATGWHVPAPARSCTCAVPELSASAGGGAGARGVVVRPDRIVRSATWAPPRGREPSHCATPRPEHPDPEAC